VKDRSGVDPSSPSSHPAPRPTARDLGAWAPLRDRVFRAIWIAALVSNLGTWMQTVGAQWLLVDEPRASVLVALVQTASTLPIALLAIPSGVIADWVDRRRLVIGVLVAQTFVGVLLTGLTFAGLMRPGLLLSLTLAIGIGQAVMAPAYQSMFIELVPRDQLPAAAALSSVGINLARSVGPALAGLVVAQVGVTAVFALNTVSFVVLAGALLLNRRPSARSSTRERFFPALRAGARHVWSSQSLRRLLARSAMITTPAMAVWALLPLVATEQLGVGATGYGLLLGALGSGAVFGAVVLPRTRLALGLNSLVLVATFTLAAALAMLVLTDSMVVALVLLVAAGAGWTTVLSTIGAAFHLHLTNAVRARGIAYNQLVLFGGQALGATLAGLSAERLGLQATFLVGAAVLGAGALTILRWPLEDVFVESVPD
jgi:predicted MFS family arabinose efflux permease